MTHSPARTLYLCYFGLREPLVQTQVLPYLRELAAGGIEVFLLTFEPELGEKWTPGDLAAARKRLADEGVRWFYLPYHKRPSIPATAYDIAQGARMATRLAKRYGIGVLHARAHIPLAMALLAQRITRCRLIFDIRGLMAEEYADAGIWTETSAPFRAVKRLERAGIRKADQLVVLTKRLREWLIERGLKSAEQIEVIPCCVDFKRFDERVAIENVSATKRFEVVYAGSVTGLYLLEEMGRFFLKIRERRPDALLRIMTKGVSAEASQRLLNVGLNEDDFWIGAVEPAAVPAYLRRAQLGLSFRKRTFSQMAASPTKVPEYLAAGLPVVCNAGIGDTDELVKTERVGIIVESFADAELAQAAAKALAFAAEPDIKARCVTVARHYFDLSEVGAARYRKVYQRLAAQERTGGEVSKISTRK